MSANICRPTVLVSGRNPEQAWAAIDGKHDLDEVRRRADGDNIAILDALPSSAAVVDQDGIILRVNRIWRRFARDNGYLGNRFFVGDSYFETCGGEDCDVVDGIKSVLWGDASEYQKKYPCHSPTEARWFKVVATPVELRGRHGALVVHIDITSEHRDHEMLNRALLGAHRRQGMREQYFAGVNHDLRNPINAILGYASLLESGSTLPVEKRSTFAANIHQAGEYMLRIVDSILALAEKEAEFYEIDESWLEIGPIVAQSRDRMSKLASEHATALVEEIEALPKVLADAVMLNRMIENLLSNAIKYGGFGATVTLKAFMERGELVIAVGDDGPGMTSDLIEKIILPFKRADDTEAEGLGLGLALVNSMMESHNGHLDIASSPGDGTTVYLRFPKERVAH